MRVIQIGIALVALSGILGTAQAQYFVQNYAYGAPVIGYGYYPGWAYEPYYGVYPRYYGYGYTWPYYLDSSSGYLGPYIAPPLYVPPEQLGFGPQAVRRFMGLDSAQRPIINRNIIIAPPAAQDRAGDAAQVANDRANAPRIRVRASNAEARDRSLQFLQFGDQQFAALNFAGAYDRYKKAADAAPDLAEPYFRIGHTLAAMGRYEQAADYYGRGLSLRPDWPAGDFRLAQIYGDKEAAKLSTLDALKTAAAEQPDSQHVQLVAGVAFFFDGQIERARGYFERAKSAGAPPHYVKPFLSGPPEAEAGELDI
jgi:tetratricopeptide (TPR) repeat protein